MGVTNEVSSAYGGLGKITSTPNGANQLESIPYVYLPPMGAAKFGRNTVTNTRIANTVVVLRVVN